LLHPLRAQLEYFVPLLRHLDTAQAEVIAVDLPGNGQSSAPRNRPYPAIDRECW